MSQKRNKYFSTDSSKEKNLEGKSESSRPRKRAKTKMQTTPEEARSDEDFLDLWQNCGKYRLLKLVGSGSYGDVALAINSDNGEKVAIKRLANIFLNAVDAIRLLRELHIMTGQLAIHPSIIQLKDILIPPSTEFNELYLVFDYVETDMEKLLKSRQELTFTHVKYFMKQLLSGLAFLHENNIIHRDIKTSNLLLSESCDLKIIDFGLSRLVSPSRIQNSSKKPSIIKNMRKTRSDTSTIIDRRDMVVSNNNNLMSSCSTTINNPQNASLKHSRNINEDKSRGITSNNVLVINSCNGRKASIKKDNNIDNTDDSSLVSNNSSGYHINNSNSSSSGTCCGSSNDNSAITDINDTRTTNHEIQYISQENEVSNGVVDSSNNVGLSTTGEPPRLKRRLSLHVQTRYYRSPEVILLEPYTSSVDVWSAGCVFAELLTAVEKTIQYESYIKNNSGSGGDDNNIMSIEEYYSNSNVYDCNVVLFPGLSCFPLSARHNETFDEPSDQLQVILNVIGIPSNQQLLHTGAARMKVKQMQQRGNKETFRERWPNASEDIVDLLTKMLKFNQFDRISCREALAHSYFATTTNTSRATTRNNNVNENESSENKTKENTSNDSTTAANQTSNNINKTIDMSSNMDYLSELYTMDDIKKMIYDRILAWHSTKNKFYYWQ